MKKLFLGLLMCGVLLSVQAADLVWQTDMPKALAQAKAENKLVLADFTGSDWCSWCKKLEKDTFSKPDFAAYAKTNLVLVRLDYPNQVPQSAELKAANAALAKQFKIEGYPTVIALKPDATTVWRVDGYLEGGPKAMIAQIEAGKKK
jgi:thioredoxin-related protein